MQLATADLLGALKAIGEETRLRIVALLQHGELTVSDLTDILGQSQPRISRHLKLLAEAGVVDKHREGTWAFFDLVAAGPIADLTRHVVASTGLDDATLAADFDRLNVVRGRRTAAAQQYFADIAATWDGIRSLHAPDDVVEAAIGHLLAESTHRSILDIGTGTGRMLQLLGADTTRIERAIGLDNSHSMLAVARANFERAELRHIDLRQGDVYSPPFEANSFDLVVIHQVLHFLDNPARAIREAGRLLTPGGQLLIVDFAPHHLEFLRTDHAHRRLGFATTTIAGWLGQSGLRLATSQTIDDAATSDEGANERLTVSMWLAADQRTSTSSSSTSSTSTTPTGTVEEADRS